MAQFAVDLAIPAIRYQNSTLARALVIGGSIILHANIDCIILITSMRRKADSHLARSCTVLRARRTSDGVHAQARKDPNRTKRRVAYICRIESNTIRSFLRFLSGLPGPNSHLRGTHVIGHHQQVMSIAVAVLDLVVESRFGFETEPLEDADRLGPV
jgi:hypothetical protein